MLCTLTAIHTSERYTRSTSECNGAVNWEVGRGKSTDTETSQGTVWEVHPSRTCSPFPFPFVKTLMTMPCSERAFKFAGLKYTRIQNRSSLLLDENLKGRTKVLKTVRVWFLERRPCPKNQLLVADKNRSCSFSVCAG